MIRRRGAYTGDVQKEGQLFSLVILVALLAGALTCAFTENYLMSGLLGFGLIALGAIYNIIRDQRKKKRWEPGNPHNPR